MDEHIDGDLAYLKTVLKITEAQTPQWNVFADAFRADREKRADLCKDAREQVRAMRSASLLDAMTMVEDQLAERLDSLRAMKAALQPLYTSLSKEQKKTADDVMRGGQNF
ncbi:MAG TPA: Spy/CpxP family protein refolding chaperone [Methylocella sp.]|nr:Spy/CpxP family protein refolding chaperone [Methylocella sp.]